LVALKNRDFYSASWKIFAERHTLLKKFVNNELTLAYTFAAHTCIYQTSIWDGPKYIPFRF